MKILHNWSWASLCQCIGTVEGQPQGATEYLPLHLPLTWALGLAWLVGKKADTVTWISEISAWWPGTLEASPAGWCIQIAQFWPVKVYQNYVFWLSQSEGRSAFNLSLLVTMVMVTMRNTDKWTMYCTFRPSVIQIRLWIYTENRTLLSASSWIGWFFYNADHVWLYGIECYLNSIIVRWSSF